MTSPASTVSTRQVQTLPTSLSMMSVLASAVSGLTKSQEKAWTRIVSFLNTPKERFFRLNGYAGTGKTYMLGQLSAVLSSRFSQVGAAPTNKATKVFSGKMPNSPCKTIYSLLGIVMEADEDNLVLKFPFKMANLNRWDVIYVDESSMLNEQIVSYIEKVAASHPHIKWIYSLDRAQLQPVGEKQSAVLTRDMPNASLTEVVRYDNEILALATHIRNQIKAYPRDDLNVESAHHDKEGVWTLKGKRFQHYIEKAAKLGLFHAVDNTKAIAWRNVTVNELNEQIRATVYGRHAYSEPWIVGDRVTVASPVKIQGHIVANIDEEGTITSVTESYNSFYKNLKCYGIVLKMDDGDTLTLSIIHEESENEYLKMLNEFAATAKQDKSKWKYFWMLKDTFHRIRYSFALTAHRAQGSTFKNVFVDSEDIFKNRDRREALKCFYVASTRPTTSLIIR